MGGQAPAFSLTVIRPLRRVAGRGAFRAIEESWVTMMKVSPPASWGRTVMTR